MRLFRSTLLLMIAAAAVPSAVFGWMLLRDVETGPDLPSLVVATLTTLAVASILSYWFASRISRPVSECVTGALEIARGRFGRQVDVTVKNEIGELAYTFNHMSRVLEGYDRENRELIAKLEQGYLATIRSLASAIDAKDPYTRGHSQRVSDLATAIGQELGLPQAEQKALAYGGLLHDIGKIGIPEAILHKAASLDESEKALMRSHPVIGAEILRGVQFLDVAVHAVRSHHERWNGTGYPEGLAGEAIPLIARIVNAADTFDACTTHRPYQPVMSVDEALEVLTAARGEQFDPRICDALVRVIRRRVENGTSVHGEFALKADQL